MLDVEAAYMVNEFSLYEVVLLTVSSLTTMYVFVCAHFSNKIYCYYFHWLERNVIIYPIRISPLASFMWIYITLLFPDQFILRILMQNNFFPKRKMQLKSNLDCSDIHQAYLLCVIKASVTSWWFIFIKVKFSLLSQYFIEPNFYSDCSDNQNENVYKYSYF